MTSGWSSFLVVTAALYLTAGVFTLIPRAVPLLGPGLLLATAAASTSALVYNVNYLNGAAGFAGQGFDVGFWLQLASNLSLMVAACVVGLALARASEVRMVLRPPQNVLPWVVVLLGVAGTLALIFQDFKVLVNGPGWQPQVVASSIAMTVWALVMPAWAALAVPRRLGVVLLAGWIWVGAAFFVYCYLFLGSADSSRGSISAFGITLLALSAVAFPFAREAPRIMPHMP
jgi:hypothetical protein